VDKRVPGVGEWQVKLCDPFSLTRATLSALEMSLIIKRYTNLRLYVYRCLLTVCIVLTFMQVVDRRGACACVCAGCNYEDKLPTWYDQHRRRNTICPHVCTFPRLSFRNSLQYTDNYRKRSKAQRLARPTCADANVHFLLIYRLAMLLPPSE